MTSATGVPIQQREPRPCSPAEAVERALRWVNNPDIVYWLSCGRYASAPADDDPSTRAPNGKRASDCRHAVVYCYKLPAQRPLFNRGSWATVSDDINYNSLIEDSEHAQDLCVPVTDAPQLGDILTYPTIRLHDHVTGDWVRGADGKPLEWIGHGSIVVGLDRAAAFNLSSPKWALVDIVHCHGPANVAPSITRSDGSAFDIHNARWPLPEHHSRLLRMKP